MKRRTPNVTLRSAVAVAVVLLLLVADQFLKIYVKTHFLLGEMRSLGTDWAYLYFVENKGIALSREKILNNVWNYDYFGDARTIDTHVKKLRSKMGEKGEMIKTIWGMGYKLSEDSE